MTINHAVNHAAECPVSLEVPLAGFSHCHLCILSQLQAFAELPALQAAAAQSRNVATKTLALFKYAVYGHFADEENELFPAVLRSAVQGEEADRAQTMVKRLTTEHREIESLWKQLEPAVKAIAQAKSADLELEAVEALMQAFLAHANFEEQQFLPLAETILARNGNHMAALGLALHLRHAPYVVGHI